MILCVGCFGQLPKKQPVASTPTLKMSASFEFHGDALGEPWADFQRRHADNGTKCMGSRAVVKAHGLKDEYGY